MNLDVNTADNYRICRFNFAFRDFRHEDLIVYSKTKGCKVVWIKIKNLIVGKGWISNERLRDCLQIHLHQRVIFEELPNLERLLNVQEIANAKIMLPLQDIQKPQKPLQNIVDHADDQGGVFAANLLKKQQDFAEALEQQRKFDEEKEEVEAKKRREEFEEQQRKKRAKIDAEYALQKEDDRKRIEAIKNDVLDYAQGIQLKYGPIQPPGEDLKEEVKVLPNVAKEIKIADKPAVPIVEQPAQANKWWKDAIQKADELEVFAKQMQAKAKSLEDQMKQEDQKKTDEIRERNKRIEDENKIIKKKYEAEGIYQNPYKPLHVDLDKLKLNLDLEETHEGVKYNLREAVQQIIKVINIELASCESDYRDCEIKNEDVQDIRKLYLREHFFEDKNKKTGLLTYAQLEWLKPILEAFKETDCIISYVIKPTEVPPALFAVQI